MTLAAGTPKERQIVERMDQENAICIHTFSDLSRVSPVVFLFLLKQCYACGSSKATQKFRSLQQQVHKFLHNSPQPGPAVFVARCLYVLPIFEIYCEGFSHMIISALRRFLKEQTVSDDLREAKPVAARLFLSVVEGRSAHDKGVIVKILEVFDIKLIDIENAIGNANLTTNNSKSELARMLVEKYIFEVIEADSYMTAVTLLEQFSIQQSGESYLTRILQKEDYKAADKWAEFMGKPMLHVLVREYSDRNLLKKAFDIIKKNNLQEQFPELYLKCKESRLKQLAEKGLWDVAEARTNGNKQLVEFLVYLAMEAGYSEKVEELADKYSLEGFGNASGRESSLLQSRYLQLSELITEDIVWVDEVHCLLEATCYIEDCKVVGLDCEWKPNYIKGSKQNKVSIMQIASEKKAFVIDLIKLSEDAPGVLDSCLRRIMQSPKVLKLGYNLICDVKQLAHSYEELGCFNHYEMLLDIQNIFKEPRGGLSGLAKKILGVGLNKTRRNSNWEQRPLSHNQLEYAALDAVVLVHIFRHVTQVRTLSPPPTDATEEHAKFEWKSYIVSHMDNPKKPSKGKKK